VAARASLELTPIDIDGFRIVPLTAEVWSDFVAVLGRGGIGGCWCMYWIHPGSEAFRKGAAGGSRASNKRGFRRLVECDPPPGLLAYDADEPVAWCRVMERRRLPGLARSRYFKTELDVDGVWSLSCFVVRAKHRGRGLTSVLTRAAIAFAREHGGRALEAYPSAAPARQSPAAVYLGVASTFERLGFDVVERRAPHKPMMRLSLA
jgi:GNAT superfamily N-acetyltransferase